MKSVGIIAEYNPFHNGHAYQLQKAKEASGADFAVAVMSGDFVQRGEPAMFEKRLRARWALENGADMVITLPTPFALASAEAFALGGVTLLSRSGIADSIAFGSECGDLQALEQAADVLALGAANGWVNGSCRKDYGSNDRGVSLQKPEKSC